MIERTAAQAIAARPAAGGRGRPTRPAEHHAPARGPARSRLASVTRAEQVAMALPGARRADRRSARHAATGGAPAEPSVLAALRSTRRPLRQRRPPPAEGRAYRAGKVHGDGVEHDRGGSSPCATIPRTLACQAGPVGAVPMPIRKVNSGASSASPDPGRSARLGLPRSIPCRTGPGAAARRRSQRSASVPASSANSGSAGR